MLQCAEVVPHHPAVLQHWPLAQTPLPRAPLPQVPPLDTVQCSVVVPHQHPYGLQHWPLAQTPLPRVPPPHKKKKVRQFYSRGANAWPQGHPTVAWCWCASFTPTGLGPGVFSRH